MSTICASPDQKMVIVGSNSHFPMFQHLKIKVPEDVVRGCIGTVLLIRADNIDAYLKFNRLYRWHLTASSLASAVLLNVENELSDAAHRFFRDKFKKEALVGIYDDYLEPILLPCPHCGGEASFSRGEIGGFDSHESGYVKCHGCGAMGPELTSTKWAIYDAWNRRV